MSLLFNHNLLLKDFCTRVLGAITLAVLATTVSAEIQLEYLKTLDTRFGTLSVVDGVDEFDKSIAFNGIPLPIEPVRYPSFSGMWSFDGADHVWVLADLNDGAQGCTTGATVIRVDNNSAKVIGTTPPCEGRIQELRLSENEIHLKYFTDALKAEVSWYHFNENGMTETRGSLPFASDQSAGSGGDVTRWIGSHPLSVLQDPMERKRFLSIMPEEEIRELASSTTVANTAKQEGDWVYGKGCTPHLCTHEWGAWGIRISDGQPAALFHSDDGSVRFYGGEGIKELKAWVESQN